MARHVVGLVSDVPPGGRKMLIVDVAEAEGALFRATVSEAGESIQRLGSELITLCKAPPMKCPLLKALRRLQSSHHDVSLVP